MNLEDRIFVALDVSKDRFYELINNFKTPTHYKIGFPLFLKIGKEGIDLLKGRGAKIFLDFKFFDIPNTMSESAKSIIEIGADFFTVHLMSSESHLKKVVKTVRELSNGKTKILGVSVLTSFTRQNLMQIGINEKTDEQVLKLAEVGLKAGIDGIVSSPLELELLKSKFGNDLTFVTPGIRPFWSVKDDQKRTTGFHQAIEKGADYVVIGRPITQSENPEEAFKRILREG